MRLGDAPFARQESDGASSRCSTPYTGRSFGLDPKNALRQTKYDVRRARRRIGAKHLRCHRCRESADASPSGSPGLLPCLGPRLCSPHRAVRAQAPPPDPGALASKVEEYMDARVRRDHFSGSVLMARDGKVLFSRGYGMANLEHDVPTRPQTKFRLGSITKQFTAMAILILQERGKLKVEDKIKKYLPDAPKAWDEITIRHLLTHTSGIPNYTAYPEFLKTLPVRVTLKELIAKFKDKPLDFKPGEKFRYSNSGYVVLGQVIETASGESYAAFLNKAIFDAAGDEGHGLRQPRADHQAPGLGLHPPAGHPAVELRLRRHVDPARRRGPLLDGRGPAEVGPGPLHGEALAQEVARGDVHAVQGQLRLRLGDRQEARPDPVRTRRRDHGLRHDDRAIPGREAAGRRPQQPRELPDRRHRRRPGRHRDGRASTSSREPKVAKVDPALYDAYAGRYEADMPGKGKEVITVTRDRDRLLCQRKGNSRVVLVPESETSFYIRAADPRPGSSRMRPARSRPWS